MSSEYYEAMMSKLDRLVPSPVCGKCSGTGAISSPTQFIDRSDEQRVILLTCSVCNGSGKVLH